MADESENIKLSLDEEAIERLLQEARIIQKGRSTIVEIDGKKWHLRKTSMSQNDKMAGMDMDVYFWQKELKESDNAKKTKRLNAKIRKVYAKKAAHIVLGRWKRWIPFMYAYMWRRIYNCSEKVSATINATDAIGENKVFYLANLGSSKQTLALSMKQVGEAVEQRNQRGESAESMVLQDGLRKKEGSK